MFFCNRYRSKKVLLVSVIAVLAIGLSVWLVWINDGNKSISSLLVGNTDYFETSSNQPPLPEEFPAKYISAVSWPPAVILASAYSCSPTPAESSVSGRVQEKEIGGRRYCIYAHSEGAAGSVYTKYQYVTEKDGQAFALSFTLRFVQCYNYDEPQRGECQKEREEFDLDFLVFQFAEQAF